MLSIINGPGRSNQQLSLPIFDVGSLTENSKKLQSKPNERRKRLDSGRHITQYQWRFLGRGARNKNTLRRACPLDNDNGLDTHLVTGSLGSLEKLPVELYEMVLLELDICSLTTMRAVNRESRYRVSSLHEYSLIIKHTPDAIRALICTRLGRYISCKWLLQTLNHRKCFLCGYPAPFIYLFRCERICRDCIMSGVLHPPLLKVYAQQVFELDDQAADSLPTAICDPCLCGPVHWDYPFKVVDYLAAQQAGMRAHRLTEERMEGISESNALKLRKKLTQDKRWLEESKGYYTWVQLIYACDSLQMNHAEQPVSGSLPCAGNPLQYFCILDAPWIELPNRSQSKDHGPLDSYDALSEVLEVLGEVENLYPESDTDWEDDDSSEDERRGVRNPRRQRRLLRPLSEAIDIHIRERMEREGFAIDRI